MNSTKVQKKEKSSKKSNLQKITERIEGLEKEVNKYEKGNILSNKILVNTEPLTFYEAIKEVQIVAIDSGNGDRLEYHNYYLEMLREYFLERHFKDLEQAQQKENEDRVKKLYKVYQGVHKIREVAKKVVDKLGDKD